MSLNPTSPWLPSRQMADCLGIHHKTLLDLRRLKRSPFKEGRDFRWAGLTSSGRLQWNRDATEAAFTVFKRLPGSNVETFAAAR